MSSQSLTKKTKHSGSLKDRKLFISQIDSTPIDINWPSSSLKPMTSHNATLQTNFSPLSKSKANVKSVRHLGLQSQTEFSSSPAKLHSPRILSSRQHTESLKDLSLKTKMSKVDLTKNSAGQNPSSRENTKRKNKVKDAKSIDLDRLDDVQKIEIVDIALSPQAKKKIQGSKNEKIMKLLGYCSANSKKNTSKAKSIGLISCLSIEIPSEGQSTCTSYVKSTSSTNWESLSKPVTPKFVLEQYGQALSAFEKEEIEEYPEIYFVGDIQQKLQAQSQKDYDDEKGYYAIMPGDHIMYRYEVIELLGRGSFGQVVKAFDHKNKEHKAIKIIRNQKKFYTQSKIEISLLEFMRENEADNYNIAEISSHFTFRQHNCLVLDLMGTNLYDHLKKNKFKGFHLNTVKKFATQILIALKFLVHHKIIHCDLKPENILFKDNLKTSIRLIDFGSSCFENEKLYTYIQSRFYRAPEVILGLGYNTQIDMWSFGCLLCELYTGYPIFGGESEQDQLAAIMEILGVPDTQLWIKSPRRKLFFEENLKPKAVTNSKGRTRIPDSISLSSILSGADKKFIDLIQKCLVYDPKKRYTPDEALLHPWIVEELSQELKHHFRKAQHKANSKQGEFGSSSKHNLDLCRLKEKETLSTQQDMTCTNRKTDRFKSSEESFLQNYLTEPFQKEYASSQSILKVTTPKNLSSEKHSSKKKLHKGNKLNGSQGSLVINTSINLKSPSHNELRKKTNKSKDNLFSMLTPQSTKENVKSNRKSDIFLQTSIEHNRLQDKLNKMPSSTKNTDHHAQAVAAYFSLKDPTIKDQYSKENKLKEQDSIIEKASAMYYKQSSKGNESFSKAIETSFKAMTLDNKKSRTSRSPKNVICLDLKSPKHIK